MFPVSVVIVSFHVRGGSYHCMVFGCDVVEDMSFLERLAKLLRDREQRKYSAFVKRYAAKRGMVIDEHGGLRAAGYVRK